VLQTGDYTATFDNGSNTVVIPAFNVPTFNVELEPSVKGKEKKIDVVVETPIDLVDGRAAAGYAIINDPAPLTKLANAWNDWIKRLSNVTMSLGTFGTEAGISSLYSGASTCYWIPGNNEDKMLEQPRFRKRLISTLYSRRVVQAYSFSHPVLAINWETILANWIHPVMLMQTTDLLDSSTGFQRISAMESEPYQMSVTQTSNKFTLNDVHNQMAKRMIKSDFERNTEVENFIMNEAEKGRGGILSSIAGAFVGAGGHALGQAIATIPY
jgi:hypothetical protein